MKWLLLIISLFLAVILESSGMTLPWVLMILLLTTIVIRKEWIFFLAIGVGIILDSVMFRTLGASSLFFVCFLGFIFAYEKKFELQSLPFVTVVSLVGSLCYLLLFGWQNIFLQTLLSVIFCTGSFFLIMQFSPPSSRIL